LLRASAAGALPPTGRLSPSGDLVPVTSRTLVLGFAAASVVVTARFASAQDGGSTGVAVAGSASVAASASVAPPPAPSAEPAPVTPAPAPSAAPVATPTPAPDSGGLVITTGGPEPKKDEPTKVTKPEGDKAKPFNPWGGSTLILDQSATANSFIKNAQQSYMPLTETWISARLRYNFNKHVNVGLRQDFFLEETDTEGDTATRHEWRLGDTWVTGGYSDTAKFVNDNPGTKWALGGVLRPPTSKESQANGNFLGAGLSASFNWAFEPNKGGKWFSEAALNPLVSYTHNFSRATTPDNGNLNRPRMDLAGNSTLSNQVRSGTLAGNVLLYALNGDLTIYDKISLSASMIFISQFSYQPTDATLTDGTIGSYTVPRNPNDTHTRQLAWFLVDVNYDLFDEVSLTVGYYNLRPVVGPGGQYTDPLGSPDSRFFFDVVVHLDALYMDATGKNKKSPAAVAKR
jgi:hypothetical protein